MDNYNPYKLTALNRKNLSVPVKTLISKNYLSKGETILDFGCGNAFDVIELQKQGYNIVGYDKFNLIYNIPQLLNNKYDCIICNFVFNVIPDLKEHRQVLETLKLLSDNVYIAVRSDIKAIKNSWEFIEQYQCYKTPKGSYQRFYNETMIDILFGKVEYIHNGNDYKLFKII